MIPILAELMITYILSIQTNINKINNIQSGHQQIYSNTSEEKAWGSITKAHRYPLPLEWVSSWRTMEKVYKELNEMRTTEKLEDIHDQVWIQVLWLDWDDLHHPLS